MSLRIFVTRLKLDAVLYHAINSYNDNELPREEDEADRVASETSPGEFLDRIVVDWILGALTRHIDIAGQYGRPTSDAEIKRQRLDAIRGSYPDYAAECSRRKQKL